MCIPRFSNTKNQEYNKAQGEYENPTPPVGELNGKRKFVRLTRDQKISLMQVVAIALGIIISAGMITGSVFAAFHTGWWITAFTVFVLVPATGFSVMVIVHQLGHLRVPLSGRNGA